jgi:hypothetical protein
MSFLVLLLPDMPNGHSLIDTSSTISLAGREQKNSWRITGRDQAETIPNLIVFRI